MLKWFRPLTRPRPETPGVRAEGVALVVGLGNPGTRYLQTRHNVGFLAVERLANRHGFSIKRNFRKALVGSWQSPNGTVVVAEPQTFMNSSGEAAAAIAQFYHVEPSQVLVVCDDVSIPFGRIRIRKSGSEGGHNGLRSLTQCLGTRDYPRLRIGVGKPPEGWKMVDYVLAAFPSQEWDELPAILDRAADAIEDILARGPDAAMSRFNGG